MYIPLPDEAARAELIKLTLPREHSLTPADIAALAVRTHNFSGSDINTFLRGEACMLPVREAQEAMWWRAHPPAAPGGKPKYEPVPKVVGLPQLGGRAPSPEVLEWAQRLHLAVDPEGVVCPWGDCDHGFHVSDPRFQDPKFDSVADTPPGQMCPKCSCVKRHFWKLEGGTLLVRPVSVQHCMKALAKVRPTVSAKDLEEHEQYTLEFGADGS